jgi:ribonuclease P protein subunit RPR2
VPDAILHKPSALNRREMEVMRRHPVTGFEIVSHIDFLEGNAQRIVRFHHERWDGAGYPDAIRGRDIPLAARIFTVADTLDAITSDRPYRRGVSIAAAREEIERGAGTQFDPQAVEALMAVPDDVLERIRTETVLTSTAAP